MRQWRGFSHFLEFKIDHFVWASVTLIFGMISRVHHGFASRAYFAKKKKGLMKVDEAL
ncbi:MAG: hypothetical protein L6416_11475 [Candidatus Omnitrophica bacterium]|nr:hypothetical protein [Candidatus Omnitrophota bacterium]